MDQLENMDLRRWILTEFLITVSCGISILSLMALRKFGFVFSDDSFALFVCVTYAISTVSTYCVEKFLEWYVHKYLPRQKIYQQRPAHSTREKGTYVSMLVDLSDVRGKFSRRRHSYPLQLSERVNYAFRSLGQTSGASQSFNDESIEGKTDYMMKRNRSTKHGNLNGKSSNNARVVLRQCVKEIDDIVEHLKSFTKSDILHKKAHSKDNLEDLSLKRAKDKDRSENSKQGEQLPCGTSAVSKDQKEVQQLSGIGSSLHLEDDKADFDFSHQSLNEANVEPYELGEQEHPKSDCSLLHHNNSTDVSSHLPEDENFQQQSENYLSHSAVGRKSAEGSLQRSSTSINTDIILDPVKLGKELKKLGIFYESAQEDLSSEYNPDEIFPDILGLPSREIEMKDFVSGQDISKCLDSSYLPYSIDRAVSHEISANTNEELTSIMKEEYTANQVVCTKSISDVSENIHRSVSGDADFEANQKPKSYTSSTGVVRTNSGSPENTCIGAAGGVILNPLELGNQLCDIETYEGLLTGVMESISLASEQGDSEETINSVSCSTDEERPKSESKESLLSRIRNIFKIKTDSNDREVEQKPRY